MESNQVELHYIGPAVGTKVYKVGRDVIYYGCTVQHRVM